MRCKAHVRFGEEKQGNSPTTPCFILYAQPGKALFMQLLRSMYSPVEIVGWKVASAPNTTLVLDALDQAVAARQPAEG